MLNINRFRRDAPAIKQTKLSTAARTFQHQGTATHDTHRTGDPAGHAACTDPVEAFHRRPPRRRKGRLPTK